MSIRVEKVDVSDEKNHIIIFDTLNQYATDLMGGILIIIILNNSLYQLSLLP